MDYNRLYDQFIADRRQKERDLVLFDKHHVLPRCLGGSNDPENLIRLSPSDHLFAHLLLARIQGGKLLVSFLRMSGMRKYTGKRGRRDYNFVRAQRREQLREFWDTPENKMRHGEAVRAAWERADSLYHASSFREDKRQRMIGNELGRNPTPETSEKLSDASNKRWSKPNAAKDHQLFLKRLWTPERHEAHKRRIAELWADPNSTYNQQAYRKSLGNRKPK